MSFNKVSLVIPCYWIDESFTDMTMACVNGVINNLGITEILVVDDGSPFKLGLETTREASDLIRVITLKKNKGYAGAVNMGMFYADGDVIIVSNNDIEFIQHDWLDHLLKPLEEGYGIVSLRTSDSDGFDVADKYEDNAKFGSIWAITREAYQALGPLDESFGRGYFEDQDYWRRARDKEIKITKNHNGLVYHAGKATFNKLGDVDILRGMFRYKQKWGDKAHLFEHSPNSVVLVDEYDLEEPGYAYALGTKELQMEEVQQRWPQYVSV